MNVKLLEPLPRSGLLLGGLGMSLALRLAVAGDAGARSTWAGAVFALALFSLVAIAGWRPEGISIGPLGFGLLGAAGLLAVPVWLRVTDMVPAIDLPAGSFLPWAGVVAAVAVTEELLLRGVLFSILEVLGGSLTALGITAIVFALLHVPLYGLHVLPLDLAVGLWLGALRLISGSVTAPAVAHILADLGAWWLV